ncbi:cytochrome P460 family protein [Microbulbifer magnicolonia]|uniref:cytochrome P460 family protein n=1 Tax=Microbulbifer magnicolonia TaxID=3109744 RepID=UPI002B412C0D|nr:cytochrome P460 family protein [Microbulbifer sp. GG15]
MKKQLIGIMAIAVTLGFFSTGITWSKENKVGYPEGYRDWTHVKAMVIQPGHPLYGSFGGIHHIYANDSALKAMKDGVSYPDGAVLIFDLLEAKTDNNAIVEGDRKVLGVMVKDSTKFKDTGGWGFEGFKGDSRERVVTDPKTMCFSCHEPQKHADYVFSTYRQ